MVYFRSLLSALALATWLGAPLGTAAEAGTLYISVEDGVAIGGYDPVSFFVSNAPQEGHADHALMWKGAVWLFVSAENRLRFEANPGPMRRGLAGIALTELRGGMWPLATRCSGRLSTDGSICFTALGPSRVGTRRGVL